MSSARPKQHIEQEQGVDQSQHHGPIPAPVIAVIPSIDGTDTSTGAMNVQAVGTVLSAQRGSVGTVDVYSIPNLLKQNVFRVH